MQEYYEGQSWKQYPGIANVVLWCVHAIEVFNAFSFKNELRANCLTSQKNMSTYGT